MENKNFIIDLLFSVLRRIDKIYFCLPDDLVGNIEEVKDKIIDLLNEYGYTPKVNESAIDFLDMVSLYTELDNISSDLSICLLHNLKNIQLEDALYNIGVIMKKMAYNDSVFRFCYQGKTKILK